MYLIKWLTFAAALSLISACAESGNLDQDQNFDYSIKIDLPLGLPLMAGGDVLNPIKTRPSGSSEMVFKVVSTPEQVTSFYFTVLKDHGFEIKRNYADTRTLSLQAESADYFLSIKGSTKLSQSPSSQSLADDETRVLVLAKPKN